MGDTTSMNLRIDKKLKKDAEALFETLGINMTTAINIFLKQSVRDQGIPFKITANKGYMAVPAYKSSAAKNMDYAEYVEARGYVVLSSAELKAPNLMREILTKLGFEVKS